MEVAEEQVLETELDEQTAVLQQMLRETELLQRENSLLESFLAKIEGSVYSYLPEDEAAKAAKRKTARKRATDKKEAFIKMTYEEKNDLATQAIEEVQKEIDQIKSTGERTGDDIRTLMEEVDLRIAEAKKDTYEFKRDIIIGGENPHTGKTSAEKIIKFMEDKLKAKEVLVEKLKLKNNTYRAQITKLEQQLAHKEEMGEVLHLVDFDQLKIENQQFMERIDDKNNELLQLKLSTGRTVQVLNDLKSEMSDLIKAGQALRQEIAEREMERRKFDGAYKSTEAQAATMGRTFKKLQMQHQDVDQPQIMEYLKLKQEVSELSKQCSDWHRKIEIASLEEQRTGRILRQMMEIQANVAAAGGGGLFGAGGGGSKSATPGQTPNRTPRLPSSLAA